MASGFGLGAAKIDTVIHTENIMSGKRIEGICKIKGGKIEQYINDISIVIKRKLMIQLKKYNVFKSIL